jgi:hypothetical protein
MANIRSTGEIDPLRWADPIPELCELVNGLAQQHGCDPVVLLATVLVAAVSDDPKRLSKVAQVLVAHGFEFRRSEPAQQLVEDAEDAA